MSKWYYFKTYSIKADPSVTRSSMDERKKADPRVDPLRDWKRILEGAPAYGVTKCASEAHAWKKLNDLPGRSTGHCERCKIVGEVFGPDAPQFKWEKANAAAQE